MVPSGSLTLFPAVLPYAGSYLEPVFGLYMAAGQTHMIMERVH